LANFIAIVDPDAGRRDQFLREVEPLVPPVPGLVPGSCAAGDFAVRWAADAHAPISVSADRGAAVIFGNAIRSAEEVRIGADELRRQWLILGSWAHEPLDGYFAALVYDAAGLLAGTDVLGRFPIYYAAAGDALLVGSSPELFAHHPGFRATFDPRGLVGILLTNGLVEGRTLLSGVNRLAPGRTLFARTGLPVRENNQYDLPISDRYFDQPFDRHVDLLDAALERTIRRRVSPSPRPALLLSGGLDSRTVAGYLARQGISPLAVTHGDRDDLEMRCARSVVHELGFEHVMQASETDRLPEFAATRAKWEHCASGFSGIGSWGGQEALRRLAITVVSGHSMDWVIGGFESHGRDPSFDATFASQNRWGLSPPVLARLLRREVFGDAVAEVIAQLRARYEGYSDLGFQRAWGYALHHRQRFHIGALAWPQSFGSWPIVPAVDMTLLALAAGLPFETLDGRRLQIELLCRKFPRLARLPIDRNSYNVDPLLPDFWWKARRYIRRRVTRVKRALSLERSPRQERRIYYRQFDINGPRWRTLREAVEPLRSRGYEYFERAALDELLPPPDVRIEREDPITGGAGIKPVMGFLMWLARS